MKTRTTKRPAYAIALILMFALTACDSGSAPAQLPPDSAIQYGLNRWGCLGCWDDPEHDGCFSSVRVPSLDMREDGVMLYGFAVDFSAAGLTNGNANAYAWVHSDGGYVTHFEEDGFCPVDGRRLYANIPDSMFPIPMRDGVPISYERFLPPGHGRNVSYSFSDISVAAIYMEQLRDAGFNGEISGNAPDYEWWYEREFDGATLGVCIYLRDSAVIEMSVFYRDSWFSPAHGVD